MASSSPHGTTRLTLVRHGRVHNPEKIFYGRLPGFALSGEGLREARCAAQTLSREPLAAVYTSPLLRARQTASAIQACHQHLRIQTSTLLTEVYSPYEGQPTNVVDALGGDVYSGTAPPYEQPQDIIRRVQKFVRRIRKHFAGRQVVAVTHGDVITFMLLWANDLPAKPKYKRNLSVAGLSDRYPATASMSTLVYRTSSIDERPLIFYKRSDCSQ
ncbi:MAG: histidine phosphatase family protein [Desulfobacterales bacterium]